jgi:hypothetical protein
LDDGQYCSVSEIQTPLEFDESEQKIPVPSFASELELTVGDLFGWLLE